MEIITTVAAMREWTTTHKRLDHSIGFVPTMGYLHEAHLSLAKKARAENQAVVLSIFVNPMQFGPKEDFATYPNDLAQDCRLAEMVGVDAIFHPKTTEIYPQYPPLTTVEVQEITRELCGATRPGHFTGVATVVCKLFNIVQPQRAYFGQKDYQQLQVIKQMVIDLNLPVNIEAVPIKREADNLAMSSRNIFLSPSQRQEARSLYQALELCRQMYDNGENNVAPLLQSMRECIEQGPSAVIDYIQICDAITLKPIDEIKKPAVVALAVRFGSTRLIDNLLLEVE